jgi:hypothetical protein
VSNLGGCRWHACDADQQNCLAPDNVPSGNGTRRQIYPDIRYRDRSLYAFDACAPGRRDVTFDRRCGVLTGVGEPRLFCAILGPAGVASVRAGDHDTQGESAGGSVGCGVSSIVAVYGERWCGWGCKTICVFVKRGFFIIYSDTYTHTYVHTSYISAGSGFLLVVSAQT